MTNTTTTRAPSRGNQFTGHVALDETDAMAVTRKMRLASEFAESAQAARKAGNAIAFAGHLSNASDFANQAAYIQRYGVTTP